MTSKVINLDREVIYHIKSEFKQTFISVWAFQVESIWGQKKNRLGFWLYVFVCPLQTIMPQSPELMDSTA